MAAAAGTPPGLCLDHLVYVVPNLEEGVAWFEEQTGVKPCVGGRHEGLGTHNALVSLGGGAYIELLAKDPTQAESSSASWLGVDSPAARLTTFCARPSASSLGGPSAAAGAGDDSARLLEETFATAKAQTGYEAGPARDMSRRSPEGKLLRWRLAAANHREGWDKLPGGGIVPFLIDWSANAMPHPSETSPGGCSLESLHAHHPDPPSLQPLLASLGASSCFSPASEALLAAEAPAPRLEAKLRTPKGIVTLA